MPPALQRARVVWAALLVATVLYLIVLVMAVGQGPPAPGIDRATLRGAFFVLSVAGIGVILHLGRRLSRPDGPLAPAVDAERMFTTYVICWAFAEAIALYGLVLGFLTRDVGEAAPFFIVSASLLVWLRPRREIFAGT